MKAIALLSRDKYLLTKEQAGPEATEAEFIAKYKELGGGFTEGSVKEILKTPKYIGIYPKGGIKFKKVSKKKKK